MHMYDEDCRREIEQYEKDLLSAQRELRRLHGVARWYGRVFNEVRDVLSAECPYGIKREDCPSEGCPLKKIQEILDG